MFIFAHVILNCTVSLSKSTNYRVFVIASHNNPELNAFYILFSNCHVPIHTYTLTRKVMALPKKIEK